ncbi:IclR family transcriptional regulator [Variovorax sp. J31P207]|uniref:IclR family transcriptional regulator n=1 Tax=Variovorax sp. J31P207 TaxID=3053510 RepID=UPI00257676CE|nr:IclR family transcriptional regulator [Variovorax sp. J31P207]MDM0067037.1 IclR family transcriptional regulator [Variovorax sp. J31P207]
MSDIEEAANEKRGIQSVDAALAILQAVSAAGGPRALGAIAKATGNAASTTHRYLVSLMRGDLVRQDPNTGWYDLGPGALTLGSAALQRMDAVGVAQLQGSRLAANAGETCFVSIWTGDGPLVVRWFHGRKPLFTSAGVGTVLPLMLSSAGQVFAAHLPPHMIQACLDKEDPPLAFKKIAESLEAIRTRGFAWIDGLIISGLRGVSVPVLDVQGQIQCALTLLSTDFALVKFPNDAHRQLIDAGREASRQLGFQSTGI